MNTRKKEFRNTLILKFKFSFSVSLHSDLMTLLYASFIFNNVKQQISFSVCPKKALTHTHSAKKNYFFWRHFTRNVCIFNIAIIVNHYEHCSGKNAGILVAWNRKAVNCLFLFSISAKCRKYNYALKILLLWLSL